VLPFDLERVSIEPSKHFRNVKMRKWDWDLHDVRDALETAYRVVPRGKTKLEVWSRKGGTKKLHVVYYAEEEIVFVINGTEGK
jgi:hypothetical protein